MEFFFSGFCRIRPVVQGYPRDRLFCSRRIRIILMLANLRVVSGISKRRSLRKVLLKMSCKHSKSKVRS